MDDVEIIFCILWLVIVIGLFFPDWKYNPIRKIGYLWHRGNIDAVHKDIKEQIDDCYNKHKIKKEK